MKTMEMRRAAQTLLGRPETKSAAAAATTRTLSSGVLFAGSSEVIIAHGPELYRLRLTRQNRLILTK